MRFRLLATIATLLIAGPAVAYDASKAPRYASPDMYRPNVDRLILNGTGTASNVLGALILPNGGDTSVALEELMAQTMPARAYGVKCDGTADDTAAIARATTQSPNVLLPRGTCMIGGLSTAANSTLRGQGNATTLKLKGGSAAGIMPGAGSTLTRFTVDGNVSAQTGTSDCIVANGVYGVTIDGLFVTNCYRHGISFIGTTDGTQQNQSVVRNSRLYSIGVGGSGSGDGIHWENASSLLIADNIIAGIVYANIGDGGNVGGSSDIKITGNLIDGYTTGIYLRSILQSGYIDPAQAFSKNVTVSGNTFRNLSYFGMINAGQGTNFTRNRVVNVGNPSDLSNFVNQGFVGPGIDATVTENYFDNIGGDAIDMGGAVRCLVSGNKIGSVNTYAIEMANSQYCTASNNTVFGQTWRSTNPAAVSATHSAIFTGYDYGNTLAPSLRVPAAQNRITGNTVIKAGNTAYAIEVKDPGDNTGAKGAIVFSNTATGFGAGNAILNTSPTSTVLANATDDSTSALGAWTPYTPTVSCAVGSMSGTATASGQYLMIGKTVLYQISVSVPANANGTCANTLLVTLPKQIGASGAQTGVGTGTNGMLVGLLSNFGSTAGIRGYDQSYPVAGAASNPATTLNLNGQYVAN